MVFKPRSGSPKPRDDIASKVMAKLNEQDAARRDAEAAVRRGQAFEEDGKEEEAVGAYLEAADAYTAHHRKTDFAAPPLPFYRLGVLLRRFQDPAAEVQVLQRYVAIAGRDPDRQLLERLQRAEELMEMAEAMEEGEFEDDTA